MQGTNGFTKSMSGVLELSDGGGTDIQDGTVTCTNVVASDIKTSTLTATSITTDTLNALTSITTNILNVTTIVVSSISLATAYITTLFARNIRSDTPATAVGLFDTQTSAINMGTPSSSFLQQGTAAIGLSGAYGANGTNGLEAQMGINIADLIFRGTPLWSSISRIRASTGPSMTFDSAYFSFSNFGTYILDIVTLSSGIQLKFHSGSTYANYDSQIVATGGTGTQGGGTLTMNSATLNLTAPTTNISASTTTLITTPTLNIQNTTPALGGNTVEIGTGGGFCYLDFHSNSLNTTDYDSRILASGGTALDGKGTLELYGGIVAIKTASFKVYDSVFRYVVPTNYVPTLNTGTCANLLATYNVTGSSMTITLYGNSLAGGTAGSGIYAFSLPSGYSINTSSINLYSSAGLQGNPIGSGYISQRGVSIATTQVLAYSSTQLCVFATAQQAGSLGYHSSTYYSFNTANLYFGFTATFPI